MTRLGLRDEIEPGGTGERSHRSLRAGRVPDRAVQAARHAAPHFEGYRLAGLWAREQTRPGDAIACVEVGTLAYFADRPVEDLLGLVTPRSIPYVAEGDLLGAFLARPTELVVDRPRIHGLMGQVVEVMPYTARVLLLTDTTHSIPVQVNRNGLRAIASGTGNPERLELRHVADTADIKEGDLLVAGERAGTQ